MTQQVASPKKSDKKVIALAVICIVLAAGLVGAVAVYQPAGNENTELRAQITEKENQIATLQAQLRTLQSQVATQANASTYITQIAYLNQQLSSLNSTLTDAYSDLSDLEKMLMLQATGLLHDGNFTQDANTATSLWNNPLDYAGVVQVEVTSTCNSTYAQVLYSYDGHNFNYTQTIKTSGTALFPILPGTVEVKIGNLEESGTNSVNATVTYVY